MNKLYTFSTMILVSLLFLNCKSEKKSQNFSAIAKSYFDGKNILLACRTAYDDDFEGAHNNHDANYLTFFRIKKFRK